MLFVFRAAADQDAVNEKLRMLGVTDTEEFWQDLAKSGASHGLGLLGRHLGGLTYINV